MTARTAPPIRVTREQELALRLVGTASLRAAGAERIAVLARAADAALLVETLQALRVLSLCRVRLAEIDPALVPAELAARGDALLQLERSRGLVLDHQSAQCAGLLEAAGVPAVALKGTSLAARVYGDLGLRPSGDVDLLVRGDQLAMARALLVGAGMRPGREAVWTDGKPLLHEVLTPSAEWMATLELHWRVHWYETGFGDDVVAHSALADGRRVPRPDHELAMTLLYLARDGFTGVRLLADLAAWWDVCGGSFGGAPALAAVLREHPALGDALVASASWAGPLVGIAREQLVPAGVRARRRATLAPRLADWQLLGPKTGLEHNVKLVDLLLAPTGDGAAWVGRNVAPPLEHVAIAYDVVRIRPGLLRLRRLWHARAIAGQLAAHAARVAWRLLRHGSWRPDPHAVLRGDG